MAGEDAPAPSPLEGSESDQEKLAELAAIVQAVRERVRAQYPKSTESSVGGHDSLIRITLPDLMPVLHARDAAQAKVAAIGSVNPRRGGAANQLIQTVKRTIARGLRWFVRDQVAFNRETVGALQAILEALNEENRALAALTSQVNEQLGRGRQLADELLQARDIRNHWIEWRTAWEQKLSANEIYFLRSAAELQSAFHYRVGQAEATFRDTVKAQHADYLGALDRANLDIQKRLWADLEQIRSEYERLIHTELRLIRQRAVLAAPAPIMSQIMPDLPAKNSSEFDHDILDYARFAERFRGSAEYVKRNQQFYLPFFQGLENVLDIGCGRGEFLELLRDNGIAARGIDLSADSVAECRTKGLRAEKDDLFRFLPGQPDEEFDGIVSAQVVEHLQPAVIPELIRLCAAKLRRGGILAIETPNPDCLAIFGTHFYLDPTHVRPVPSALLSFYLEESGMGSVEVHQLSPAAESIPEIRELPEGFRNRFFNGLDYAIVAWKL